MSRTSSQPIFARNASLARREAETLSNQRTRPVHASAKPFRAFAKRSGTSAGCKSTSRTRLHVTTNTEEGN